MYNGTGLLTAEPGTGEVAAYDRDCFTDATGTGAFVEVVLAFDEARVEEGEARGWWFRERSVLGVPQDSNGCER